MDCAPKNAIVRYYQKIGRTTEKLWNIFGKFYRVNLEILGYPSRVSLPKNTPRYSGGYSFLSSRSDRAGYLQKCFGYWAGGYCQNPSGQAGRVFLVPDSSLVHVTISKSEQCEIWCSVLTGCCQALNVSISGNLSATLGGLTGIYNFGGYANEKEYWVHHDGSFALWLLGGDNYWAIGPSGYLGSLTIHMFASSTEVTIQCPNHDAWTWSNSDGTEWVVTNDVSLECTGKIRKMLEVFVWIRDAIWVGALGNILTFIFEIVRNLPEKLELFCINLTKFS